MPWRGCIFSLWNNNFIHLVECPCGLVKCKCISLYHVKTTTKNGVLYVLDFMLKIISTSWSSLFSFQCSDFGFAAYVTVYYYYHVWWCTIISFSPFFFYVAAMERFCIICSLWSHLLLNNVLTFFPALTGGCSEGLGAFWFFFKQQQQLYCWPNVICIGEPV